MFQPSMVRANIRVYIILRPYVVQNKYVPHTNSTSPQEDQQCLAGGEPHSFGTSLLAGLQYSSNVLRNMF
jgi:hypothetical protein